MMPSPEFTAVHPVAMAVRALCFKGSIVQGSSEHAQIETWVKDGYSNRRIWAQCHELPNISGKPSSYVIQAIRHDNPKQCKCCNTGFYPSRSAKDSEGLYCRWRCYNTHGNIGKVGKHRGLGQRRNTILAIKEQQAVGPMQDYHLTTATGSRATIAIRGSIEIWLQAENHLRRLGGLDPYRQAEQS